MDKERSEDYKSDSEMKIVKESLSGEHRSMDWSSG